MKISMKESESASHVHVIKVCFNNGKDVTFNVHGTEEAISIYKTILFAYEDGVNYEANRRILHAVKNLEK